MTQPDKQATQNILDRLQKVKQIKAKDGLSWQALCPAHGDKKPSLVVTETSEGKILLKCWTGCSTTEILNSIGLTLADLHEEQKKEFTPEEKAEYARKKRLAEEQREKELLIGYRKAEKQADYLYKQASYNLNNHRYINSKQISPNPLIKRLYDMLLIPMYYKGGLVNLQRIFENGDKSFLADGRIIGAYSPIGDFKEAKTIVMCEGWATGETLRQITGFPVVAVLRANNFMDVAKQFLSFKKRGINFIVAGDDDRDDTRNAGRIYANEVADFLGCEAIFPDFPDDAPLNLSDFNDLQVLLNSKVK